MGAKDWGERQGAFIRAYREDPRRFPHQPVHIKWSRWPETFVRDQPTRGFLRPTTIKVLIWTADTPRDGRPSLQIELPPRSLPEGDHDADVVAVGEVELNGAMALLAEDGSHFPIYNPTVPPW